MLQFNITELDYLLEAVATANVPQPHGLVARLLEERDSVARYVSATEKSEDCYFRMLFAGRDIVPAVKMYRDIAGLGLREAADICNFAARNNKPVVIQGTRSDYERALLLLKDFPKIQIELCEGK